MKHIYIYIMASFFLFSCSNQVIDSTYQYDYKELNNTAQEDNVANELITVYKRSLEVEMNEIIATVEKELTKAQPECMLGNLLADAILFEGERLTGEKVDIGIMNYGGIRLPALQQGNLTLGTVYELMPFDNFLVTQKIDGTTLKKVFDSMANRGGWPIAGATYVIQNNEAKNIQINGKPLDMNTVYNVSISDYLANGGDKLEMLKKIPQKNTNLLLRDAFIHYFKSRKTITGNLENRVTQK